MLSTIEGAKNDLNRLAEVLNQFKSEAVQVKLLDRFFEILKAPVKAIAPVIMPKARTGRPPKAKAVVVAPEAPKRRGRPPKAKIEAATKEAPKRRGRAPKAKSHPAKSKAKSTKRRLLGGAGTLNALIEKGYFKSRRTIADVVKAGKSQLGVSIPVTHLSGPLGSFVKGKKLQRAKNKDGRFEYWVK